MKGLRLFAGNLVPFQQQIASFCHLEAYLINRVSCEISFQNYPLHTILQISTNFIFIPLDVIVFF